MLVKLRGDVKMEIVSVYEDLQEDKSNLGRLPGKWLAFLEEVIQDR